MQQRQGGCQICQQLVNNVEIKEPAVTLDPVLGEIVKNITKVNILLQDLIKNYEKLKKMSEPETIDGTYEDTEIHELFKGSHEKKNKKSSKPTTTAARTIRIQGTAMEVSSEKTYNTATTKRWKRNRHNKKDEKKQSQRDNSKIGLPAQLKEIAKKLFSDKLDESQDTTKKSHPSNTKNSTNLIEIGSFSIILQNGTVTTEPIKEKKKDLEPRFRHRTDLVHKNDGQKERRPIYNQKQEPAIQLSEIDSTTIEEGKVILNEENKINVLREAYGDACLKLVVRKCYMACKSVFKEVCRTNHKCSPEFKQSFKKHAITGCDSSFYNNSVETMGKYIKQANRYVKLPDMTRDGYLAMACGPISSSQAINPPPKSVRRKTGIEKAGYVKLIVSGIIKPPTLRQKPNLRSRPSVKSTEIISSKPILRADKYELACQQASRMKCFKACKHAAVEACKEEKCREKKKTALDKACKSHCKQSYGGKDSDDESDSDESGSESEEKIKEPEDEWR